MNCFHFITAKVLNSPQTILFSKHVTYEEEWLNSFWSKVILFMPHCYPWGPDLMPSPSIVADLWCKQQGSFMDLLAFAHFIPSIHYSQYGECAWT